MDNDRTTHRNLAMAAAATGKQWPHLQPWREERMRYDVLAMLYRACDGEEGCAVRVSEFAAGLSVEREELFRAVEYLDRWGFISYHGAGPEISLTPRGKRYIERDSGQRRSLRGSGAGP